MGRKARDEDGLRCAVYTSHDICRLFNTNKNTIDSLIEAGTIPEPLPSRPKGKRMWSKTKIDQHLGLTYADDELVETIYYTMKHALDDFARRTRLDELDEHLKRLDKSG